MEETLKTLGFYLGFIVPPIIVKLYDLFKDKKQLKNIIDEQYQMQKQTLEQMSLMVIDNRTSNELISEKIKTLEHNFNLLSENYKNKCKLIDTEITEMNKKYNSFYDEFSRRLSHFENNIKMQTSILDSDLQTIKNDINKLQSK